MKITIKYFLDYKKVTGHASEELFFKDYKVKVKDIFKVLNNKYNIEFEKILSEGIIMVNNKSINQLKKKETILKEGDELLIMPMISGG